MESPASPASSSSSRRPGPLLASSMPQSPSIAPYVMALRANAAHLLRVLSASSGRLGTVEMELRKASHLVQKGGGICTSGKLSARHP